MALTAMSISILQFLYCLYTYVALCCVLCVPATKGPLAATHLKGCSLLTPGVGVGVGVEDVSQPGTAPGEGRVRGGGGGQRALDSVAWQKDKSPQVSALQAASRRFENVFVSACRFGAFKHRTVCDSREI